MVVLSSHLILITKKLDLLSNLLKIYLFVSKRKTMITITKLFSADPFYRKAPTIDNYFIIHIYIKRVSEIILKYYNHYVNAKGKVQKLDNNFRQQFKISIVDFVNDTLHIICLAYYDIITDKFNSLISWMMDLINYSII
jgi:hypothetical protein